MNQKMVALETEQGERQLIRARGGVVIAAGGFAFNTAMVGRYATPYAGSFPTGSSGCDGSGILLCQSVGGG